jgi:type VI secretion system protein ImpL
MKKLFAWFIKPPVYSFFGVLVLSLLAWFEGPLLAFDGKAPLASERVRSILIALLFAAWASVHAWRWGRAKLANLRLMKSVAAADSPALPVAAEAAAEAALLARRMQEAMEVLRKARLGGKRGALQQLPWYMFVGAPGSGKTTALQHSGLTFPLAEAMGKTALRGVGGTRHCDWWFTDEAVLLDTAGRYTTQDSHGDVDKAAWSGAVRGRPAAAGRRGAARAGAGDPNPYQGAARRAGHPLPDLCDRDQMRPAGGLCRVLR